MMRSSALLSSKMPMQLSSKPWPLTLEIAWRAGYLRMGKASGKEPVAKVVDRRAGGLMGGSDRTGRGGMV